MATDQFNITHNPFTPRDQFMNPQATQSQGGGGQQLPRDLNPYNMNVVHELVRRGHNEAAASQYPYEYNHLYGNQANANNSTKIKMYNNAAQADVEIDIGADHAKRYNAQQWGKSATQQFDHDRVSQGVTDEEKSIGQRLAERVDYNQIGQINGSDKRTAYDFFNKDALLTNLWAYRYGLSPEQVLALNHKDREEYSRKLLVDFYNRSDDSVKAQIGNPEQWIEATLKRYAFDAASGDDDKFSKTLAQTGGRVVDGFVDGLSNIYTGAKALVTGYTPEKDEVAEEKAKRLKREAEQTKAEKSLLQRFDSLAADGRWEDLALLVATNTELQSALLGTSVGSLIADTATTLGLTWGAAAITAPFTGGASTAAAGAVTATKLAGMANALRKLYQAGKFATVSSVNMVGNLAKEITLDGNVIEPGSELHKVLAAYGLINIPLNLIGGSIEGSIARHLANRIGKEKALEVAPTLAQKVMTALGRKGYTFTKDGVKRSMVRSAGEWLVAQPGKKVLGEGIQEAIQGGLGSAVRQGAGPDSSFDPDRIDYETTKRDAIKEGIAGAAFGAYHGAASSVKAKSQRNRDLAAGKQYNDFERFKAEADQSLLDQIEADITAGKYNIDGTERTDGGAGLPTDPAARKLFDDNVRQAVLWRHFKGDLQQPVTADVDPDLDDDTDDGDNQQGLSQEELNEQGLQKRTSRWAKASAWLHQVGLGAFDTEVSPVKDLRGLSKDNVDQDWADVKRDLENVAKGYRKQLDKLEKAAEKAEELANAVAGQPVYDQYAEKARLARAEYEDKKNAAVGIETALFRARDAKDVANVVDTFRHHLGNDKTRQKADRLRALSDHAIGYDSFHDNANRWNVNERQQLVDLANEIAQRNRIWEFTMTPDNLVDGLNRLSTELRNHGLVASRPVQQDIERLRILSSMVKLNRPEMLATWGNVDKHVAKIKPNQGPVWAGRDNQYNWARAHVNNIINTAKQDKTNVFTEQDRMEFKSTLDALYDTNPIDAFNHIIAKMQVALSDLVTNSTPQDSETRRAMIGAIQYMRDVRERVADGSGTTTTPRVSNRYGQKQLGRKFYDTTAALMGFAEANRYAVDVANIAKLYNINSVGVEFSTDMLGHITALQEEIANGQHQLKASTTAKDQFVITDVLRGDGDKSLLNVGNEVNGAVLGHLQAIADRIRSLSTTPIDPAPELGSTEYGDLVERLITDQRIAGAGQVREWLQQRRDTLNGEVGSEADDHSRQENDAIQTTPIEPPLILRVDNSISGENKSVGQMFIDDIGEPGIGYFRITQDGPFVLSRDSAVRILNRASAYSADSVDIYNFIRQQMEELETSNPTALPPAVKSAILTTFSSIASVDRWVVGTGQSKRVRGNVINEYVGVLNNNIIKATVESNQPMVVGGPLLDLILHKANKDSDWAKLISESRRLGTFDNIVLTTMDNYTGIDIDDVVVDNAVIYVNTNHPDIAGLLTKALVRVSTADAVVSRIHTAETLQDAAGTLYQRIKSRQNGLIEQVSDSRNAEHRESLIALGILTADGTEFTPHGLSTLLSMGLGVNNEKTRTQKEAAAIAFGLSRILGATNSRDTDGVVVGIHALLYPERKWSRNTLNLGNQASTVYLGFGRGDNGTSKMVLPGDTRLTQTAGETLNKLIHNVLSEAGLPTDRVSVVRGGMYDARVFGRYDPETGDISVSDNVTNIDQFKHSLLHEAGHRASDKLVSEIGLETYVGAVKRLGDNPFVHKLRNSQHIKVNYERRKAYANFNKAYDGWEEALLTEEVLVDLYAARLNNNWKLLADQYGIKESDIPKELKDLREPSLLRDFFAAIADYLNRLFGDTTKPVTSRDVARHLAVLVKTDRDINRFGYLQNGVQAQYMRRRGVDGYMPSGGVTPLYSFGSNPPNPNKPKDRTTVYTFSYHPDNLNVTDNPTAWWDNSGWNFVYADANGNPVTMHGLNFDDMMTYAQNLNVFIDQRQQDVMMQHAPQKSDQFQQFSPPMAKMWRGINRLFRGTDENVNPLVRNMMNLVQKIAIEQHGADQFLKMAENILTHITGTDKEGTITTLVNKYRTQINHQINNPGVGGVLTMFDHKNKLYEMLRATGWSEEKANRTLYAMRAQDVQRELTLRQQTDPKWKGKPIQAGKSFTAFSWDGNDDPDGSKWLGQLSQADRRLAEDLKKLVTELNDSVLRIEHQSGRISDETFNAQIGKFYVPLKNETDKATAFQRMSVGRYTLADDPLTHLLANHEARLRAAEQSMIYQALMDAVTQYGLTGLVTFNSSTLTNKGDGEYAMTADGFLDGSSVTFYRDGKKVRMTIVHPVMKKALAKRSDQAQSEYLGSVAKLTGFLGLMRTGTPTFFKTAFLRDMGMSLVNTQAAFRGKEDFSDIEWAALGMKTAARMVKSLPMIAHAKWTGDKGDFTYRVYRSEGGIGNVTAYDIESVSKSLERDIFGRDGFKGKVKTFGRKYLNALHASDDAARYALWINYLEKKNGGAFADEQALVNFLKQNQDIANIARDASKNITGNFEQRGMDRSIRSHYIFWNAAMAGSRTFYGMLNPRYGTYGLKALSLLASLAFYSAWGGEEDEDGKNKESRMKNLGNVITLGGVDIGLAQELRPVYHLGQAAAFLMDGTWDMNKAVGHVLSGLSQAVVPVSPASTGDAQTDLLYAVTPTFLQPLVLQNANKTFFGGENAPAPYDTDGKRWEDAPDYLRAQSSSSTFAKEAASFLHEITGGGIDVAPGSIDMYSQQLLGSVFAHGKDIAKRVNEGEDYMSAIVNQFTKSHNHEYNEFALRDEFQQRLKTAKEKNRIGEEGEILGKTSFTDRYKELEQIESDLRKELKRYVGDEGHSITELYRQLDAVKRSSSYSPDEFYRLTDQIDRIRQARNTVYGKYNRLLMEMGY